MKKTLVALFVALSLLSVIFLASCGGSGSGSSADEFTENHETIANGDGAGLEVSEDNIKMLLGEFTREQLRISGDIFDYTLKLSVEEFNGVSGCRAEAFPEGAKKAEQIYFIDGYKCYIYDASQSTYVSILSSNTGTTSADGSVGGAPVDSPVEFQYHAGNNKALQEVFSGYDLSAVGLEKELSEYILVITERIATVEDGKISVVDVYEKDGTITEHSLGYGASGAYYFDNEAQSYVAFE